MFVCVCTQSTGDAVYEFTLQAYVTVEKLVTGKSAEKPKEKVSECVCMCAARRFTHVCLTAL